MKKSKLLSITLIIAFFLTGCEYKDNNQLVSGTLSVEKGTQYSVKVKGSISGSVGSSPVGKCLTVVFSSPNCLTREEISVDSYPVSSGFGVS